MERLAAVVVVVGSAIAACADQGTEPPVPEGPHAYYRITKQTFATSGSAASAAALDLDDDGIDDNQIGRVLGYLAGNGVDANPATAALIASGELLTVLDVQTEAFARGTGAGVAGFVGLATKGGDVAIDVSLPANDALVGRVGDDDVLDAGTGTDALYLRFGAFGVPTTLDLAQARVRVGALDDVRIAGVIGGALRADAVEALLVQFADDAEAVVARDCTSLDEPPTCGCPAGSGGRFFVSLFDGDVPASAKDCAISLDEVKANTLVKSLTTADTVDLAQPASSDGARHPTLLSLGLSFEAQRIDVTSSAP